MADENLFEALVADLVQRLEDHRHDQCAVCRAPLQAGGTVLLGACLHAACVDCWAHARETAEGTLMCELCNVASPAAVDDRGRPPAHPVMETALAARQRHACDVCAAAILHTAAAATAGPAGAAGDADAATTTPSPQPTAEQADATHYCHECSVYLCPPHGAQHRKGRVTKLHVLTPVGADAAALGLCEAHGTPYDGYCPACRAVLCLACSAAAHLDPEHGLQLLDAAVVERARAHVNASWARTDAACRVHARRAEAAAAAVAAVDEQAQAVRAAIDAQFDALQALLEQRRRALQQEAAATLAAERAAASAAGEAERVAHTVTMSTAAMARQLANGSSPASALVLLEPAMCARLDALADAAEAPQSAFPVPTRFTVSVDAGVAQAIAAAGRLTRRAEG